MTLMSKHEHKGNKKHGPLKYKTLFFERISRKCRLILIHNENIMTTHEQCIKYNFGAPFMQNADVCKQNVNVTWIFLWFSS